MYTLVIPLLLLATLTSVASTNNKTHLLATVLFYTDGKGHRMVVTGDVPVRVNMIIRHDIKLRVKDALVKVVPIYKNRTEAPAANELMRYVKKSFDTVFVAPLPEKLSNKILSSMTFYKDHKDDVAYLKKHLFTLHTTVESKFDQNVSNETLGPETLQSVRSTDNSTKALETIRLKVYYGIESKCENWSVNCNQLPDILRQSRLSLKKLFVRRKHKTTPMTPVK